jgi:hypothetical protein
MGTTYAALKTTLDNNKRNHELKKLAPNTWLRSVGDILVIRFYEVDILTYHSNGNVVYDSGGYYTNTNKGRMTDWGAVGWTVYRKSGEWHLWHHKTGTDVLFYDGIVVNGASILSLDSPETIAKREMPKKIKTYANAFIKKFLAGKIEKPGPGDCFYCALDWRDGNGNKVDPSPDHLISHMKEKYYVPSLLLKACTENRDCLSRVAQSVIAEWLSDSGSDYRALWGDVCGRQIGKALRLYMEDKLRNSVPTVDEDDDTMEGGGGE